MSTDDSWRSAAGIPAGLYAAPDAERRFQVDAGHLRLDVLAMPRKSDTLVVAFHGALDRAKTQLPRFERLRTLRKRPESLMFVADPLLEWRRDLTLGWYVGCACHDLTPQIVRAASSVADACEAEHVLFAGASGGGFAALQASASLPGSMALAFSPQTRINAYYPRHVDRFAATCFGGVAPDDWADRLGQRQSLVARYREGQDNLVWYVQNANDPFHMENHYAPIAGLFDVGNQGGTSADGRVTFRVTDSAPGHHGPGQDEFVDGLEAALQRLRERRPGAQADRL